MNKQELIDKLKKRLTAPSEIDDADFNKFYNLAINYAIYFAEQLDEPEKPVVPQYVADWYEENKDDLEYNLYKLCTDFREQKLRVDLNGWFGNDDNKPIETLVKMKLYGYEVEKEKLYTVEIPSPNCSTDDHYILSRLKNGKIIVNRYCIAQWKKFGDCQLTESEIKQDFDRAWQFAKEVEND